VQGLSGVVRPSDMVVRPTSPTIDSPLKPVVVTEGETAKFMVKIHGEPTPSVTWYVNDAAVHNVSPSFVLFICCSVARWLRQWRSV